MSIATVVTRGYGSFGTIPFVVTRGYSIGEITLAAAGLALLEVRSGDASLSLSSGLTSRAPLAEPGTLVIRSKPGTEKA